MKKHTKKLLSVGLSAALVAPLVLSNEGLASAATKVTEGPVTFAAVDDTKGAELSVLGKKVTVIKLDQQIDTLASVTTAWSKTGGTDLSSNGEAALPDKLKAGKYALTLKLDDKTNVTRFLNYTPKDAVTKTSVIVPTLDKDGKLDRKFSGTISGIITGGSETKLAIVGKDTTWTTIADAKGYFSVALPAGTYDVVVIGKDPESKDDKQNQIYKGIKVIAGQSSTPLDEMNAGVDWKENANKLGFTELKTSSKADAVSTFTNVSKEYKGTLDVAGKVSAYTLDEGETDKTTDDIYTLIGEGIAKYDGKNKNAPFSIKLAKAQPNKKIIIVAEDEALNRYSKEYSFTKINPQLKSDTTKNEIGQPIDLTFTDASKLYEVADKSTFVVKIKDPSNKTSTLNKKDGNVANDFSVSSGKITINPSVFSATGDYEITVTSPGFEDQTITQTIGVSTVKVAALNVKAEKGTAEGSTKLTATPITGNTLKYEVGNAIISTPVLYTKASVDLKAFDGKDITGVDASSNKYVGVYEINKDSQIVKFKLVTLTAAQINPVKTP